MRGIRVGRVVSAIASAACVAGLPAATGAEQASPAKPTDRCVVLISVDGLAGYYLDDPKAHIPTLRRMASEGASCGRMRCSFPTVTWPNHTTLVTGVPPTEEPGETGSTHGRPLT